MSLSGVGAPGMVASIMTAVEQISRASGEQMMTNLAEATALLGEFLRPQMNQALTHEGVEEYVYRRDIVPFTLEDLEAEYGKQASTVAADMVASFEKFQTDYFPTDYFDGASEWITDTLTKGGSGINEIVEDQRWTKARTEVLAAAEQETAAAVAGWAARGFAIPPGALVYQLAGVEQAAQKKIGEASRAAAIESFDAEVASIHAALEHAIELRGTALNAAREHMIALTKAKQLGSDLTKHTQATHERLNTTLYEYHANLRETRSWNYSNRKYEIERDNYRDAHEGEWMQRTLDDLMKLIQAALEALGAQGAAGLNGLHATAAVSGTDVTAISELG